MARKWHAKLSRIMTHLQDAILIEDGPALARVSMSVIDAIFQQFTALICDPQLDPI
jgi:hypothetical protein